MRNLIVGIMMTLFIVCGGVVNATVLTFDDIYPAYSLSTIQNGYGGFDWTNMGCNRVSHYGSYINGYTEGVVSGDYVAFNRWERTGFISDGEFDFNGAYLTGAWNDGLNIRVEGFLNGNRLYDETVVVDTIVNTPESNWFTFNYEGIDSLEFSSFGGIDSGTSGSGTHFAMDNFTFNEPMEAAPVPEPATMFLLGTGLVGIGYAKRKFKK